MPVQPAKMSNPRTAVIADVSTPTKRYLLRSAIKLNWRIVFCTLAIVATLALMVFYTMVSFVGFSSPPRGLLDRSEWPEPFASVFRDQEHVAAFGLSQFFDNQIVFEIYNHADSIDHLIAKYNLQPTEASHPHAKTLSASMPTNWPTWANSDDDRWYAT